MFDHGDLNLAMSARHQPWGVLCSGLGKKKIHCALISLSLVLFDWILLSLISFTVPMDYQCLAVGVAALLILLSGLIDLKIKIKTLQGSCVIQSVVSMFVQLYFVSLWAEKNRKRLLLVRGINLNGGSRERSSISAGEDMSLLQYETELWL